MDAAKQKLFLDRRQQFSDAKSVLFKLHQRVATVSANWIEMTVVGHARFAPYISSSVVPFDPTKWPTVIEVVDAWKACNQGFKDMIDAYKQLGADDLSYLQISTQPSP